ncbi:MAG: lysozyme [Nitrosomonas sp.]|nr:lysozyme [Nitrosomonas sp.]
MKLSDKGRALLIELEGKRNHAYQDVVGLRTIGVGHLIKPGEDMAYLTDEQVDELLTKDLLDFEVAVDVCVDVKLNQNEFDALVIFAFNVGKEAFRKSTLRQVINRSEFAEVPKQLMRWNKSGGKVVAGLTNRRKKEIEIWEGVA